MRMGQDKGKQLAIPEDMHESTIKLGRRWKVRMQGGDEASGGSSDNILRQSYYTVFSLNEIGQPP